MRVHAGQDATQRVTVDRAREAQRGASRADPGTAGFSAAGVVLLDAVTDAVDCVHANFALLEVVPGLAGRQLADRKHRMGKAAESGWRAKPFRCRLDRPACAPPVQGVCVRCRWFDLRDGRSWCPQPLFGSGAASGSVWCLRLLGIWLGLAVLLCCPGLTPLALSYSLSHQGGSEKRAAALGHRQVDRVRRGARSRADQKRAPRRRRRRTAARGRAAAQRCRPPLRGRRPGRRWRRARARDRRRPCGGGPRGA